MPNKLPRADFIHIVRNTPLVAIDLVLRSKEGKVLLGRRNNEPAKDWFFVPGGRIFKDERLADAFVRIMAEELGITRQLTEARYLGVFEHLYPTNVFGHPEFGTHYVVNAYELRLVEDVTLISEAQHSAYVWMSPSEALAHPEVHPNTKVYVEQVIRNA